MLLNEDYKFMRRSLDLAIKSEGMTYPNPMVGAVMVYNNTIIGEGYHIKAGMNHAEVNAINSVSDGLLLNQSTLYVTLEPCSHFGKTPPCTDLIISKKIPRIVIGTTDTSGKIPGIGIRRLKEAGCDIVTDVLGEECRRVNRRFFTFHEKQRPYITLKWAQSADGYMDVIRPENSCAEPYWITGEPEKVLVHKWRASEQAILVGAGTIRSDNPGLNVREWKGNDPVKIILTRSGNLKRESAVFKTFGKSIVFTRNTEADFEEAAKIVLNDEQDAAVQILDYLYKSGIQSLLIEGGAMVLNNFITQALWDEARIFSGTAFFKNGIKAPQISGKLVSSENFYKSNLKVLING